MILQESFKTYRNGIIIVEAQIFIILVRCGLCQLGWSSLAQSHIMINTVKPLSLRKGFHHLLIQEHQIVISVYIQGLKLQSKSFCSTLRFYLIPILNNTNLINIALIFLVAVQSHGVCLQSSYLKMYLKTFGFFMRDE